MSVRGYGLSHIRLAVEVEESGLCTPDFLDQKAAKLDKHYLRDEALQDSVERARHFIFDELAALGAIDFRSRLYMHLSNFATVEKELNELYDKIVKVSSK